jgi:ArsR family transcriptional regulator
MTKKLKEIDSFIPCCREEFTDAELSVIYNVSKVLGNEARIEIYKFLRQSNTCMTNQLVDYLPLAQSTISQHLKVMKDAGVIIGSIDGTTTNYCINSKLMKKYSKLVEKFI